jgi:hypothetical protein
MDSNGFVQYLQEYVNSEEYRTKLHVAIAEMSNPNQRFQALLELANFVIPKVKTVDPEPEKKDTSITINYVQS